MEDLLASFNSVEVTSHPNTPYAEHPHFALYKPKFSGSSQEERRKKVLEARREARYDLIAHLRSIEETALPSEDDSSDGMECDQDSVCYRPPRKYRNFLMLSEWLVDVPNNFATEYFAVPCPVGKRTLIVSGRGKTCAYTRSGYKLNQFPSLLPGGSRRYGSGEYAMLDCIYSQSNKTYYILDVMCWVNQSVIGCDTFFRFEWLKARSNEAAEGIGEISRLNPFRFKRLPYYDCSPETLTNLLNGDGMPFSVDLDGVLFYNRNSHYTHGPTPLVGWLKAFMFPEILGINAAEKYQAERPAKYTNLSNHIQYAKELKEERMQERKKMEETKHNQIAESKGGKSMEVMEAESTEN
ncbi:hypothetical protein SK128_003971 [Halocaridina rubra]|uniref:Snurportin-1 n=1 Tax=Halocaridina rubra TaxID=373956 RepID=A0AAN8WAP1_HALRR